MRRLLIATLLVAAPLVPGTARAELIATCGAFTPAISNTASPIRPVESCIAPFEIKGLSKSVTTLLQPENTFTGRLGLRVRGPNALWTQYSGIFVSGQLVNGQASKTFTISPGDWLLEVYVDGPAAHPVTPGHAAIGEYRGTISG